jgi:hypothetical protein
LENDNKYSIFAEENKKGAGLEAPLDLIYSYYSFGSYNIHLTINQCLKVL